ncbi:MAG TPA: hypothetical protein VFQ35_26540, partial [Polyangiaceae bacterium]|nr:hypothetical protein [Polyangiaceae bacterium]
ASGGKLSHGGARSSGGESSGGGTVPAGGAHASGGGDECGGAQSCAGTGGQAVGTGGVPADLGKPCEMMSDCSLRTVCDIETGVCAWGCKSSQMPTTEVACASGQRCVASLKYHPSRCEYSCTESSCPDGLVCQYGRCLRPGTRASGMACDTLTDTRAECAPGLGCASGTCVHLCDPVERNSVCGVGEQCDPLDNCSSDVDPAEIGAPCTTAHSFCAGNGVELLGQCTLERECLLFCDESHSCPDSQTCSSNTCRTPCDATAEEPGCPDGELCRGEFCSSLPGGP